MLINLISSHFSLLYILLDSSYCFAKYLQIFWECICSNSIELVDNKLIFKVPIRNENSPIPYWGLPESMTDALLVRNEYKRIRDRIKSNSFFKFILVRGTKGIGKSLFIYYLIYDLVVEALSQGTLIPSFLLVYDDKRRYILTLKNGSPLVTLDDGTKTDYLISDAEFDLKRPVNRWNLHVEYSKERITPFMDAIGNAGAGGAIFTMGVLTLPEMLALSNPEKAKFIHMVFGGSARYLRSINGTFPRIDPWYDIVRSQLKDFISCSEFEGKDFDHLIDQSSRIISDSLSNSHSSSSVFHSLFYSLTSPTMVVMLNSPHFQAPSCRT